jgi:hypothetical protein
VQSSDQYYYYKVSIRGANYVHIDYITGIPAPTKINPYRFALLWNNTLWLCNDQNNYKNGIISFAPKTCSIANGAQTYSNEIGNDEELVAGATLFSRFGGSIYDNMLLFKRSSTYMMDGNSTENYKPFCVSAKVGCVAPLTVQTCDTSYEVAPNLTKHVVIWQSDRGIEYFDGNAITMISDDIDDFFNNHSSPNYIDKSLVSTFSSSYEEENMEYHWITNNREMVYNLRYKKWFEIDRGTGKKLTCGFAVCDSYGNKYTYGGTDDGFLERLENGTTFDGNPIVFDMWTVDNPLNIKENIDYIYRLRNLKVSCVAKNTETITITASIYPNTELTAVSAGTFTESSSARVKKHLHSFGQGVDGYCHSFRLRGQSSSTLIGFEPLNIGGFYFEAIREDN